MGRLVVNKSLFCLGGLVGTRRVPELAAHAATEGNGQNSSEQDAADGHGRHLVISFRKGLVASKNSMEGENASIVPVLARETLRVAIILMKAANEVEGREGTPEDHIDQATTLEHASKTPHSGTAEDGVTSDALNALDFNGIGGLVRLM